MASPYQAVRHNTLTEDIVVQLEKLVISQQLQAGDPLPGERELARDLQVSRPALREAIRMLAQKGLVRVRRGRGTFVTLPGLSFLGDSLQLYLTLYPHLLRDFVEARLVIETEMVALAARRASDENLAAMKKALDDLDAWALDPDLNADADLAFHIALAGATGNQVIQLLLTSLRGALRENIRYFALIPSIISECVGLHHEIYDAVAARNVEAAQRAMREHFRIDLAALEAGAAPPNGQTSQLALSPAIVAPDVGSHAQAPSINGRSVEKGGDRQKPSTPCSGISPRVQGRGSHTRSLKNEGGFCHVW